MSTNIRHGNISNDVTLALAVPTGTAAGDVVPVGDKGLLGFTITPIATADGPNAVGLQTGQASVRLLPAQVVAELPVDDSSAFAVGDIVYGAQNGGTGVVTYSTTTSGYPVGYVVGKPSATSVDVYLGSHLEVTIEVEAG